MDKLLSLTTSVNGEKEVKLHSVIVHETDTGYAQAFSEDAYSKNMGAINLDEIIFSDAIKDDWAENNFWEKMKRGERFLNPTTV